MPAPTTVISSSQPIYIREPAGLTCIAESIPELDRDNRAIFRWYLHEEELRDDGRFVINQTGPMRSELTVPSLEITDSKFSCSAAITEIKSGKISAYSTPGIHSIALESKLVYMCLIKMSSNYTFISR